MSFCFEHGLEKKIRAYEIFSLRNPKLKPLSHINGNPIIGFRFDPKQPQVMLTTEETSFLYSTKDFAQKAKAFVIPYTQLMVFFDNSYLTIVSSQDNQRTDNINGHRIINCKYIQSQNETPFISLHLDDGTVMICYLEGAKLTEKIYGEKDIKNFTSTSNASKTGYELSITKNDDTIIKMFIEKQEYRRERPSSAPPIELHS